MVAPDVKRNNIRYSLYRQNSMDFMNVIQTTTITGYQYTRDYLPMANGFLVQAF